MRVVHAVVSDRFAGVEQFIRRLATAQSGAGDRVTVIGGPAVHLDEPLRAAGATHVPAQTTRDVISALRRAGDAVDVVNSHMTAADVAAVAARATRSRTALVSTRHFARRRGRVRLVGRMIEARLDAEISISHAVATAIGVPSTVVHTGLDGFPLSTEPRRPVVLMAQRLQPEKRTEVGVRAFIESELAAQGWTLQIAGTGPERAELEALVRSAGLADAVQFLGFRDDVPGLMATSGMLLAPCPVEGLGLTVLEAMASGLPVVAADAGGHVDLLAGIDPRTFFPPEDAATAAERLRALAADPDGRAVLGGAERERQRQRFSLPVQVDATAEVYRAAIERRRGRR